jgi:hypothetical protein
MPNELRMRRKKSAFSTGPSEIKGTVSFRKKLNRELFSG